MNRILIATAVALLSVPAIAQDAPAAAAVPAASTDAIKAGLMLRDASNVRVGKIDRVNEDGSVKIIFNSRFVTVPADTLRVVDGGASTTLTKREIARLR